MEIEADPDEVWKILADVSGYPAWWPRSLGLRVISPGKDGLGGELEIKPSGGRPFLCRVEELQPQEKIRLGYSGGFIEGHGEWLIESASGRTRVTYRLDVVARGWLVAMLGKFINLPAIHSRSMQEVLRNLAAVVSRP